VVGAENATTEGSLMSVFESLNMPFITFSDQVVANDYSFNKDSASDYYFNYFVARTITNSVEGITQADTSVLLKNWAITYKRHKINFIELFFLQTMSPQTPNPKHIYPTFKIYNILRRYIYNIQYIKYI